MKTTDWKFDFSSLPCWNNRDTIPCVYDEFFDIPQSDTLCCIYSIAEVSMCNNLGFLAIIRTKEKPELFLNVTDGVSFCPNVSASTDGKLIFLQPSIYDENTNTIRRPILIVDISRHVFSLFITDNQNPCYKVVELRKGMFKIEADEYQKKADKRLKALSRKKIRTDRLKWHDLAELHSLLEVLRLPQKTANT